MVALCLVAGANSADAATVPVASINDVSVSSSSVRAGDRATFKVTLENKATRPSGRTKIALRLARSSTNVRTILSGTLQAIGARTRKTFTLSVAIPAGVPPAKYDVLACSTVAGRLSCPQDTDLRVTAPAAKLAISPTTMSFGSIVEGASSSTKRFVVSNSGRVASGDLDLSLSGDDDDHFTIVTDTCRSALAPGATCVVEAVFRPRDDGELKATLKADPDDGPSVSARLSGIGRGDDENDGSDETGGDDVPTPCGAAFSASAAPGSVLSLTNWKLTLPTDGCDSNSWADEVTQPQLKTFTKSGAFFVNADGTGVAFRAGVAGARTSENTKYPRSELREMTAQGEDRASWSNKAGKGTHTMTVEAAITKTPAVKPEVVAAQIHDADDDVVMIRLYGRRLVVDADDSKVQLPLDENYVLGTRFKVTITATNGNIRVTYDGSRVVDYQRSGDGLYFKAGCYTLSNTSFDAPAEYGEVVIYKLAVAHS